MVPLRSARRRRPLTCVTDLTYWNRLHVPNITSVTGYRKACSRLHGAGGRALAMRTDTVRSFANTGGHTPSVDYAGFPQDFPADARVLDPGGAIQSALGPGDLAQFEPAPSSIRAMLRKIVFTSDGVPALDELKWFAMTAGRCRCREGAPFMLTRTGCTGEIGYELFFERSSAPRGSGRMCWKPCSTPPRGRESRPASRSCSARFLIGLSLGDKISRIRRILRGHARLRGTWRHSERRDRSRRRRARHILGRAALGRVPKPEERMAPAA